MLLQLLFISTCVAEQLYIQRKLGTESPAIQNGALFFSTTGLPRLNFRLEYVPPDFNPGQPSPLFLLPFHSLLTNFVTQETQIICNPSTWLLSLASFLLS